MHSNDFGNAVFYAIPYVAFTLLINLPLRTPKPKASKPVASKSVPPTKRPSPVPLPSQSLKRVKEETDWLSSDQYRMHEQQWYGSAEADEWGGCQKKNCQLQCLWKLKKLQAVAKESPMPLQVAPKARASKVDNAVAGSWQYCWPECNEENGKRWNYWPLRNLLGNDMTRMLRYGFIPESACEGFFVKKQPLYYIFTPSHLQI